MGGKGSRKKKAFPYKQKGKQSHKRTVWYSQKIPQKWYWVPPFTDVYLFSPPPNHGFCLKTVKQSKTLTIKTTLHEKTIIPFRSSAI
jgi:hypothetical protein